MSDRSRREVQHQLRPQWASISFLSSMTSTAEMERRYITGGTLNCSQSEEMPTRKQTFVWIHWTLVLIYVVSSIISVSSFHSTIKVLFCEKIARIHASVGNVAIIDILKMSLKRQAITKPALNDSFLSPNPLPDRTHPTPSASFWSISVTFSDECTRDCQPVIHDHACMCSGLFFISIANVFESCNNNICSVDLLIWGRKKM